MCFVLRSKQKKQRCLLEKKEKKLLNGVLANGDMQIPTLIIHFSLSAAQGLILLHLIQSNKKYMPCNISDMQCRCSII